MLKSTLMAQFHVPIPEIQVAFPGQGFGVQLSMTERSFRGRLTRNAVVPCCAVDTQTVCTGAVG